MFDTCLPGQTLLTCYAWKGVLEICVRILTRFSKSAEEAFSQSLQCEPHPLTSFSIGMLTSSFRVFAAWIHAAARQMLRGSDGESYRGAKDARQCQPRFAGLK